jgi:hypothetical protein
MSCTTRPTGAAGKTGLRSGTLTLRVLFALAAGPASVAELSERLGIRARSIYPALQDQAGAGRVERCRAGWCLTTAGAADLAAFSPEDARGRLRLVDAPPTSATPPTRLSAAAAAIRRRLAPMAGMRKRLESARTLAQDRLAQAALIGWPALAESWRLEVQEIEAMLSAA